MLVVFADQAGTPARRLLIESGSLAEVESPVPAAKSILIVPGDQVTVHWLTLDEGLAPAQAAAAARLMLAGASADPLDEMHFAVGRAEGGLTPVAVVPAALMARWLANGGDYDAVVPAPLMLAPPETGFVRREWGDVADYRALAAAFTIEPELAKALIDGAPVETLDEAHFEAALAPLAAAPPLNLRQGPFARRRQWRLQGQRLRRMAVLAIALALLSLAVQVATILGYTFAADRMEAEAQALAAGGAGRGEAAPAFGATASVLFEAVRATPNVELSRIDYRPDGSLTATVMMDNPATLAALRQRIESSGLSAEPAAPRSAGGRPTADLVLRPA